MKRVTTWMVGLAIGFLGSVPAWSSNGSGAEAWVRAWNQDGGKGTCSVFGMRSDGFGHLLVAGDILGTNGLRSHFVVKFGAQGDRVWETLVPVPQGIEAGVAALAVDGEGNAVITGGAGTVKVGGGGEVQWTAAGLHGRDMALDPMGNVVIAGFSDQNLSLAKLSSQGSNLWTRIEEVVPGNPFYRAISHKVAVNATGQIFEGANWICRETATGVAYDNAISTYDSDGNLGWRVSLDGCFRPLPEIYQALHPTKDGGVSVVYAIGGKEQDGSAFTAYNNSGELIVSLRKVWAKVSVMNSAGNLFGSMGTTTSHTPDLPGTYYGVIRTAQYDTDGFEVWRRDFSDGTDEHQNRYPSTIVVIGDSIVVSGYLYRPNSRGDIVTLGYDAETGRELWVRRWNGAANGEDEGRAVVADEAGNVFVAGTSYNAAGGRDVVLLKYATLTPVAVEGNDVAVEFPAPVGATVEIQGSTNLVDWLDLGTTQADSEGVARYRDTNVLQTLPQRYYRSRRE